MKKTLSLILALLLILATTAAMAEPVTITMMTQSPTDPYAKWMFNEIDMFNEKFEGKYKIETEFGGAQSADRLEKMKVLNASRQLPVIVTQLQEDVGFAQTLSSNGRLLDVLPYFNASPEWQEYALPNAVQSSINLSGGDALYFIPNNTDQYIGFYYNKQMLKDAGYDEFPEADWDAFWKLCDDLKAAGHTPIAMDTLESAWCTMLTSTSSMGASDEATAFMTQLFPTNFDNPYMRNVFDIIQRIFANYTTGDAAGAPYAVAANNFCSENVAIIANGPWMMESMYDESYAAPDFAEKVGYATYPSGIMIVENDLIGPEGISMDVSKEQQEAAIEWYKFKATPEVIHIESMARGASNPKVPLTEEDMASMQVIAKEYYKAVSRVKKAIPSYQTRWDGVTMYEVFAVELPNLVTGAITVDEMIQKMNDSATRYVADLEASKG